MALQCSSRHLLLARSITRFTTFVRRAGAKKLCHFIWTTFFSGRPSAGGRKKRPKLRLVGKVQFLRPWLLHKEQAKDVSC
jgi:hypothetical protein